MPWFVAKRVIVANGQPTGKFEYRVFSEDAIESIAPDWDWASGACDTQEEAQREADEQFWDEFD
jgi:hypothetical protein